LLPEQQGPARHQCFLHPALASQALPGAITSAAGVRGPRSFQFELGRKKQKSSAPQQKLKEIRVRPKTGEHDVDTKVNQARKFLEHKDRVQVYVIFRGRELQRMAEGRRVLDTLLEKLADVGKMERPPHMEGKRMVATLAPK
jgi:translation initiation factor IF-3